MYSNNNPKILMELAKGGDSEAFGHIYHLYLTPVYRYIYFRLRNKEEAEDLTQTVFLKVYQSIHVFRVKNQSPLAYFLTIARNTVIDYWRKKKDIILGKPEKVFEKLSDKEKNPQELFEREEEAKMIHTAIEYLTDDQQEIIILKFINELSNQEIANVLGKTEASIRQLQHRALKALRQHIKNNHE